MRGKRIAWFFIMIFVGLGLGLVYGWIISPVEYVDTTPDTLREDYKTDYVLMVAEIYKADQNLEQAARRLGLLADLSPARIVVDGILAARDLGYAPGDIELMNQLAKALQSQTPATESGSQP